MGGPGGAPPGGGQPPGNRPEGIQGRGPDGEGSFQGRPPTQGGAEGQTLNLQPGGEGGQRPDFQAGGEGGQRGNFQPGGREGGPPGGGPGGPPGGSWYKVSLRNVGPYTCILAFFVLITCVIEKSIKRFSHKKISILK